MDQAKNFAKGTLAAPISDADTSLDVLTGDGLRFPAPEFNATIWNSTDFPDPSDDPNVEVVRVTAITGDAFTITRGQEGTAASDHGNGKTQQIIAGITAKVINDDLLTNAAAEGNVPVTDTNGNLVASGIIIDIVNANGTYTAGAAGWSADAATNETIVGDISGESGGTQIKVADNDTRVTITKSLVLPDLPSSDPAVAGQLYYDTVTGIVKRSAG